MKHRILPHGLLLAAGLGWAAAAAALPPPGSVVLYSDGTALKRLPGGSAAAAQWQDHRLRHLTLPSNPLLPPLARVGLDGRIQYREHLDSGDPDRLLRAAPGTRESFQTRRTTADGAVRTRHFECAYLGETVRPVLGRRDTLRRYRCERFTLHRKFWTRDVKEVVELDYSPRLGLVVERRRETARGRSVRRLLAVFAPGAYRYEKVRALLAGARGGKR